MPFFDTSAHTDDVYLGIGPKISQSVLTAAFLFAFKDVLYEQTVRLRSKVAK